MLNFFSNLFSLFISAAVTIVSSEVPKTSENTAVKELQRYIEMMPVPQITLNGSPDVQIHIGDTALAREQNIAPSQLPEDTYVLRSVGNHDIILSGGGSRGTLYAVGAFLENFAGIMWLTPETEFIPEWQEALKLNSFDLRNTPKFPVRELYQSNWLKFQDKGRFAVLNRLNAYGMYGIGEEYGGALRYGGKSFVHTFDSYFPVKDYMQSHPEYFSLKNGKRVGGQFTGQLCLSNPEIAQVFTEKIKAELLKDEADSIAKNLPPPILYDVSQNDNSSFCSCDDCVKITKAEGTSGLVLQFVNKIAREIKTFRPNVKITTLAYGITENPPTTIKPEKNILIRLTNTAGNKTGSILASEQKAARQRIIDWNAIGAELAMWEYPAFYGNVTLPYPSEFFYADLYRFYHQSNIPMLFIEFSVPPRDDMRDLKLYLNAKLLENPEADVEALTQKFLTAYYGEAAEEMKAYRNLLFESVKKHKSMVYSSPEDFNFLDMDTILQAARLFDTAEKKTAHNSVLLQRVKRDRFNLNQAILVRFRRLTSEWDKLGKKPNDFPFSRQALANNIEKEWKRIIENELKPELREAQQKVLEEFKAAYAGFPDRIGPVVSMPQMRPGTIDLPIDLALAKSHKIVNDPESSAGIAAKINAKKQNPAAPGVMSRGAYSPMSGKRIGRESGVDLTANAGKGYKYYYCGSIVPEFSAYCYFLRDWTIQFSLNNAVGSSVKEYDIYLSAKYTNTPEGNDIFIDRCILIPKK